MKFKENDLVKLFSSDNPKFPLIGYIVERLYYSTGWFINVPNVGTFSRLDSELKKPTMEEEFLYRLENSNANWRPR